MLVELETLITEHEVIFKQTAGSGISTQFGKEIFYISMPKKTAVEIARQILQAYPKETINQIIDDLKERK